MNSQAQPLSLLTHLFLNESIMTKVIKTIYRAKEKRYGKIVTS